MAVFIRTTMQGRRLLLPTHQPHTIYRWTAAQPLPRVWFHTSTTLPRYTIKTPITLQQRVSNLSTTRNATTTKSTSIPLSPPGSISMYGSRRFDSEQVKEVIYEGPFWKMLQLLKRVSIFSCSCTLLGIPLLAVFGNEKMSLIQRGTVGITVVLFAIGTTATLHFICKPYVVKLLIERGLHQSGSGKFSKMELVTLNIVGRTRVSEIGSLEELSSSGSDRIFASFRDTTGRYFYVHEEDNFWKDKEIHRQMMEVIEAEAEADD